MVNAAAGNPADTNAIESTLGRHWYALTDNGDWMELTPDVPASDPDEALGVSFFAVDVADDEDLFALADQGEGVLLGRVTVVGGRPVLHLPQTTDSEPTGNAEGR
jgi:hypothetical protein